MAVVPVCSTLAHRQRQAVWQTKTTKSVAAVTAAAADVAVVATADVADSSPPRSMSPVAAAVGVGAG